MLADAACYCSEFTGRKVSQNIVALVLFLCFFILNISPKLQVGEEMMSILKVHKKTP